MDIRSGGNRKSSSSTDYRRDVILVHSPHLGLFTGPTMRIISPLLFFVGFSLLLSQSLSLEVVNPQHENLNIKMQHGPTKYIIASYFEKYQNLFDSTFQDFIADKLMSGSCQLPPNDVHILPKLSITQRHLIGQGSHRHLSSSIKLSFLEESSSHLPSLFCNVIFIERLPSGVFADPFELQHLLHRGVFADVTVMGDTNLELPSFLSNRSAVEIHTSVHPKFLSGDENDLEMNISLPLHARYPPLDESGYSEVRFDGPDVFMHCCVEGSPGPQCCLFMPNDETARPNTSDIVWLIPSGRRAHANIVCVVTFIAAFASTILIVLASIFSSDDTLIDHVKLS